MADGVTERLSKQQGGSPQVAASAFRTPLPAALCRPRLLARMRIASAGKVTVLRGPAGSGKSTLLADWMRIDARPRLVPVGPDPTKLYADAVAALELHGSAACLVLDGVDCWPEDPATGAVAALLALPEVRLVLSTRTAPALPLSRWRMAGEVTEIEASELAFTPAEAAEVWWRYGLPLSEVDAASLVAHTEGWPALVCLVALARVDGRFDDDAADEFLRTEIYDAQSPAARDLLVRMSQVLAVRPELAEVLTGRPDTCRLLDQLRKDGLLVRESRVAEDAGRDWYRLRRPVLEFLCREADRTIASEVGGLRLAAAGWHAEHGDAPAAVRLAAAAGNGHRTAELVARFAGPLLLGPDRALLGSLRLPIVDAFGDRDLAAALAVVAADRGDAHAAAAYAALTAQAAVRADDQGVHVKVAVALAELMVARRAEPGPSWRDAAERLIGVLDAVVPGLVPGADAIEALAWSTRGIAHLTDGELDSACRSLARSTEYVDQTTTWIVEEARAGLALLALVRGEPARAVRSLARGFESGSWAAPRDSGTRGLGRAVLDWGRWLLGEAPPLQSIVDRAEQSVLVAATRARSLVAGGDIAGADEVLRPYARPADEPLPRLTQEWLALAEADFQRAIGRPVHALTALSRVSHDRDAPFGGVARIMSARAYLASAAPARAASLVAPVQEWPDAGPLIRVESWLVGALAAEAQGHDGMVGIALAEALTAAAPDGIVGPLREAGVTALLERHRDLIVAHPTLAAQIATVSVAGSRSGLMVGDQARQRVTSPRNQRGHSRSAVLNEPITAREAVVLRYLPTLLTLNDIAQELSVSPNTVKSHLRHIYRKLAVGSRRDAVRQARRFGLLWD